MYRLVSMAAGVAVLTAALAGGRVRADDGKGGGSADDAHVLVPPGTRSGGWGGPVVTVSSVRGSDAIFVGGRGGWILDGRFTIGGGGFGLANSVRAPRALQPTSGSAVHDLGMGYGGLWLEYTIRPTRLVHLSLGTLVGGGGVNVMLRDGGDVGPDDGFFVLEPTAAFELNLMRAVRVDAGVSYRWVAGVDLAGALGNEDLRAWGGSIVVKFGKF